MRKELQDFVGWWWLRKITSQKPWLYESDNGFEIVLKIDGTYFSRELAEEMVLVWGKMFEELHTDLNKLKDSDGV